MSADWRLENGILRNLLVQTTRAYEAQLQALDSEKELAQVTLASIGDGVITTDAAGRVEYLNPSAVRLTGWSIEEARGRPLEEVLLLIDDATGAQAPVDLQRCLQGREGLAPTQVLALVRRDGRRFAISQTVEVIRGRDGEGLGAVLVFRDVTERQLLHLQLAHQARHDALTGLLNREAFEGQLWEALSEVRDRGAEGALCYIDLDQFKLLNETCGHGAGDQLLTSVARLLQDLVEPATVLARLGGDEFGILLRGCSVEAARERAESLQRALEDHVFTWQETRLKVGASIGVVPLEGHFAGVPDLLSAADHACYVAKEKGRHRIQVYREDDAEVLRRHGEMRWVIRIQEALASDRFALFAQPIVPLAVGRSLLGHELLIRLRETDGTLVAPRELVRAAERYGLMAEVDRWVVRRTLQLLQQMSGPAREGFGLCCVNLSALSVGDEAFLEFLASELVGSGLDLGRICFEITETAAVSNLPQAQRLIHELRGLGCRFALDDFGSGMSSYGSLKNLPVDFLKIDGGFVQDLLADSLDRAMVESIHRIGNLLGIQTIAESVANPALARQLAAIGVDWAQGYWFGRPRPVEDLLGDDVTGVETA